MPPAFTDTNHLATSNGWDVATEDPTWISLEHSTNTMFASCDSIAKQPHPDNTSPDKKADEAEKNNTQIGLLYTAFSWLYNSGVLRLPPL